jgi:hypothetical protein
LAELIDALKDRHVAAERDGVIWLVEIASGVQYVHSCTLYGTYVSYNCVLRTMLAFRLPPNITLRSPHVHTMVWRMEA